MRSPGMHRNPFRFQITPAAALVTTDVYFPLSLAPAAFWNFVGDGGNIRITKQDGITPVAREVSGFDAVNKVGSLYLPVGSPAATSYYIYFGNCRWSEPAVDAAYGKYAVWESAAKLVAHLEDMTDSTVNQNNGSSATPPSFVAGQVGKAASFDGSTQLISFPAINNQNFTWMGWFEIDEMITTRYPWGQCDDAGNNEIAISITSDGRLYWAYYQSGYKWRQYRTVSAGAWHFLAGTYNGATASLHIDNQAVYNTDVTVTIGTGTKNLMGIYVGGTNKWPGKIDEARIYSRALSSTEITAMYANQSAATTFWPTIGALEQV